MSYVEDFIAEFDRLKMRCSVEEEVEQIIACFLGALKPEIADIVHLQQYWTYADVCHFTLKVEKQFRNRGKLGASRFVSSSRSPPMQQSKTTSSKIDTPTGMATNPPATRVLRCFKCQGVGHMARECANKQRVTLVVELDPVYDT